MTRDLILVVNGEENIRTIISLYLKPEGFVVTESGAVKMPSNRSRSINQVLSC